MTDAFVLGGVRTPVGRYGGSLSHLRTDDLLGQTMVAACERLALPLDRVEDIAAGCVNVAHEGMGDIARWGALAAGFPIRFRQSRSTASAPRHSPAPSPSPTPSAAGSSGSDLPPGSSRCRARAGPT